MAMMYVSKIKKYNSLLEFPREAIKNSSDNFNINQKIVFIIQISYSFFKKQSFKAREHNC